MILLAGIISAGGIVGPFLLLSGLSQVSGLVGSLLLNLEAPFTVLLAVFVFGEHLGFRETAAALVIVAGALMLSSFGAKDGVSTAVGVAAIAGACLAWALDNNLTQRVSLRDPIAVARTKSLGAGTASLALAWGLGAPLPGVTRLCAALLLGFTGYGVSLVLAVRAMRRLGAAREAILFALAPFAGAVAAVPILGDRFGPHEIGAALVLALGVMFLLMEQHAHWHAHEAMEHEHGHLHDEHHQHPHAAGEIPQEPHAHVHRHEPLSHSHPHRPDLHHRHRH